MSEKKSLKRSEKGEKRVKCMRKVSEENEKKW